MILEKFNRLDRTTVNKSIADTTECFLRLSGMPGIKEQIRRCNLNLSRVAGNIGIICNICIRLARQMGERNYIQHQGYEAFESCLSMAKHCKKRILSAVNSC